MKNRFRLLSRRHLGLPPKPDMGRCFFVQRGDDKRVRVSWTRDFTNRLAKLPSEMSYVGKVVAAFPCSKETYQQVKLVLAPYKASGRWYNYTPPVAGFIVGVQMARMTTSEAEDHFEQEMYSYSDALEQLSGFDIDESMLRQWGVEGVDIFYTHGGHTRYGALFLDRVRQGLSTQAPPDVSLGTDYLNFSIEED